MKTTLTPFLLGALMLGAATTQADARMGLPAFEELDIDNTGEITQDQFQAAMQAPTDRMVARLMEQANDDGLLDEDALRAGLESMRPGRGEPRGARLFSRIDSNGDGVIDADEYARFTARMEERRPQRPRMRGND